MSAQIQGFRNGKSAVERDVASENDVCDEGNGQDHSEILGVIHRVRSTLGQFDLDRLPGICDRIGRRVIFVILRVPRDITAAPDNERNADASPTGFAADYLESAVLQLVRKKDVRERSPEIFREVEFDRGDLPDPVSIGIAVFPDRDAARRVAFHSQRVLAAAVYNVLVRPSAVIDHDVIVRGVGGAAASGIILVELDFDLGDVSVVVSRREYQLTVRVVEIYDFRNDTGADIVIKSGVSSLLAALIIDGHVAYCTSPGPPPDLLVVHRRCGIQRIAAPRYDGLARSSRCERNDREQARDHDKREQSAQKSFCDHLILLILPGIAPKCTVYVLKRAKSAKRPRLAVGSRLFDKLAEKLLTGEKDRAAFDRPVYKDHRAFFHFCRLLLCEIYYSYSDCNIILHYSI